MLGKFEPPNVYLSLFAYSPSRSSWIVLCKNHLSSEFYIGSKSGGSFLGEGKKYWDYSLVKYNTDASNLASFSRWKEEGREQATKESRTIFPNEN